MWLQTVGLSLEVLDVALDVSAVALLLIAIPFAWRLNRASVAVLALLRRLDATTARADAARDKIDALNAEVHRQEVAALKQRIQTLEGGCPKADD